jgi:putative FmdB family regulatory protein
VPTYEYQCDSCTHKFEAKQSIKDDPLSSCPQCGKAVRRVISSPGIMFKGSGWYITDYSDKLKQPVQAEPAGQSSNGQKESGGQKDATASSAPAQTAPATSSGSGSGSTSPGTSTSSSSTTPSNSSTATSS